MNPILFDFGFIQLRYYGLMYAIGILFVIHLVKRDVIRLKINLTEDDIFTMAIVTFLGGILGARAYYVVFNWHYYFVAPPHWYEFIAIWHGGLAIHGGLITGPIALLSYCKRKQLHFPTIADMISPGLILAQAIGRIGNLMNGDAHGYPTTMPWGLVFKYGPAAQEFPGKPLHPVMLYESALNLTAFFILFSIRKKGFRPGFVTASYIIAYSVIRFFVSFFRADDLYFIGLRAPHLISIVGLLLGLALIWKGKLYQKTPALQQSNSPRSSKK